MVDMSHYEKEENLEKTERITTYLHERGIATEAEPGRINGGEDGVKDTGDLEGLLTTKEEARRFVDTGIDFLAPAFGNVHGNYGGVENIKLDFERYAAVLLSYLNTVLREVFYHFPRNSIPLLITSQTRRNPCRHSRTMHPRPPWHEHIPGRHYEKLRKRWHDTL